MGGRGVEDFEDLVVLRGNTEVISLNVLMAFTAYGQIFGNLRLMVIILPLLLLEGFF